MAIAVDAAVAQKGPVAADIFHRDQVNFTHQDFFFVVRGFGYDAAEGVTEERASPKFQTISGRCIASYVAGLMPDAIYHSYEHPIRDGVRDA